MRSCLILIPLVLLVDRVSRLGHYEITVEWRNSKRFYFSRKFGTCIRSAVDSWREVLSVVALLARGPFHAAFLADPCPMLPCVGATVGWFYAAADVSPPTPLPLGVRRTNNTTFSSILTPRKKTHFCS